MKTNNTFDEMLKNFDEDRFKKIAAKHGVQIEYRSKTPGFTFLDSDKVYSFDQGIDFIKRDFHSESDSDSHDYIVSVDVDLNSLGEIDFPKSNSLFLKSLNVKKSFYSDISYDNQAYMSANVSSYAPSIEVVSG